MTRKIEDIVEEKKFDLTLDGSEANVSPRAKKIVKKQSDGWKYVSLAGELGFDIALPMVVGGIIGMKVDEHWGTQPKATIGLFLIGLGIGCTSLIRIVRDVIRKR